MADMPTPYVPSAPPTSPNRNPPDGEALRSPTGNPEKFGWVVPADVANLRLAASELARGATHPIAVELRNLALRLDREIQERAARQDLGFAPTAPEEIPAQAIVDAGLNVFALTLWCESYRKIDPALRLELVYRGCRVSIERWPAPPTEASAA